ncbi:Anaphase-promoting complex subunit cut9 [Sphaceloma murrayae]|uniref:Anaphase-promoting complex subunit cut9 n=1 Tax=Sphaceloma murrayae TaxID=2082308 RepID=A0A2K1QI91_9PEZI|nr:Anaphase-promoting complex subunit cut9 [Sphaceloma murrayae]
MADVPPPPPPPHGAKTSPLPNGNYDIFIIPPHSAGSGFLYLPSLKPNLNSFVAGFCTALLAVGIYNILVPALSQTLASLNSGIGILLCIVAVGAAFSYGRTAAEATSTSGYAPHSGPSPGPNFTFPNASTQGASTPGSAHNPGPGPGPNFSFSGASAQGASSSGSAPRPGPSPGPKFTFPSSSAHSPSGGSTRSNPPPKPNAAQTEWEKAKEQTRQRAEERRKADELKARQEEAAKKKAEAEKAAKAAAEKERWEQQRAREKDARELAARERIAKERLEREKAAAAAKKYEKPTAQSATESDYFTQYKPADSTASSVSGQSESSYAASVSTARTTPPPRDRGPYKTTDPNKVMLMGVYTFVDKMGLQPVSMLEKGRCGISDGLILRITTEGLFIDDDVVRQPQREWDVKAWSIKLLEIGRIDDVNIFRATLRDVDNKKYFFVLPADQGWKVDTGLQRLRKGSQARALGLTNMSEKEIKNLLTSLGWK